jgi:glycosyltransferase involved in cell wall biosynthesis
VTAKARPAVSLLVITRNHEAYIDEALRSVSMQTLRDFEVVVIDDCSSDRTVERIRSWMSRTPLDVHLIVNERNLGICATKNVALRACRGEFVAGLSGDDYCEPCRLDRQYALFRTLDRSVAVVFGKARIVSEAGDELGVWFESSGVVPDGEIFDELIRGNFLPAPTAMVRRDVIEEVGGYDPTLFYDDYDLWLRIAARYRFRYLPEVLTNYRLVDTGASRHRAHWGPLYESTVRILLKWHGRGPVTDDIVVTRARQAALGAFASDRRLGRTALRRLFHVRRGDTARCSWLRRCPARSSSRHPYLPR